MLLKYLKIIVLIITKVCFITSISFASIKGDCFNSSFYIKNINVDLTKESINQARFLAEQKARLIGFNRLLDRLIINNKNNVSEENNINTLRYYGIGAQIIKDLNIRNMILISRSKKKIIGLDGFGLKIKKQIIIK